MIDLMMTELVDESGGGIARERGRAQVVVLEASEGDALQGDEVKHYEADSAWASGDVWARYPGICAAVVSVSTKVIVYAGIESVVTDDTYNVRGHATAWTRTCLT